jgi:hypothetical protein
MSRYFFANLQNVLQYELRMAELAEVLTGNRVTM